MTAERRLAELANLYRIERSQNFFFFQMSLTIHKIPFSFFAYLSTLEGVTKVKRQKRIYKILIRDFAHEHFFGAN